MEQSCEFASTSCTALELIAGKGGGDSWLQLDSSPDGARADLNVSNGSPSVFDGPPSKLR